jgi:hypothetical protein
MPRPCRRKRLPRGGGGTRSRGGRRGAGGRVPGRCPGPHRGDDGGVAARGVVVGQRPARRTGLEPAPRPRRRERAGCCRGDRPGAEQRLRAARAREAHPLRIAPGGRGGHARTPGRPLAAPGSDPRARRTPSAAAPSVARLRRAHLAPAPRHPRCRGPDNFARAQPQGARGQSVDLCRGTKRQKFRPVPAQPVPRCPQCGRWHATSAQKPRVWSGTRRWQSSCTTT